MAKVNTFGAPPKSTKDKRKAAGSSGTGSSGARRQEDKGEASSTVPRPAVSEQQNEAPTVPEPVAAPVTVAQPGGDLVIVDGEEEEADRPLKRRRVAQIVDRSPRLLEQSKGKEKAVSRATPSAKGKGKEKMAAADKWEAAINLDKAATVSNIKVALHIAERAIPPRDEEFYDSSSIEDLTSHAVRNAIREVAFVSAMRRRIELLSREINSLLEQAEKSKAESSDIREERDLARAQLTSLEEKMEQLSSLEEEKKLWEDERNMLRARLASVEADRSSLRAQLTAEEIERVKAMAARNQLSLERIVLQNKLETESRLKAKFLQDCHEAIKDRAKAEDMLKKERASIKKERIEAIKRWQRRFLQEECLEYSCDLALMILQSCYACCVPEGSDGPPFNAFAEPRLPTALGLSLEEVRERAAEDRGPIPDEELDLDSAEEDEPPGEENESPGEGVPSAAEASPGHSPAAEVSPRNLPTSPSIDF